MRRVVGVHVIGSVIQAVLCLSVAGVALAASPGAVPLPAGPPLAPRTHGIMLYLSRPLGGGIGAASQTRFGFRIEQVRMMGNNGAPDAGVPLQHRALVGWQFSGPRDMHAADMKLVLGGRLTYDVRHGGFGSQSAHTAMFPGRAVAATPASGHPAEVPESSGAALESKGFVLRSPDSRDTSWRAGEGASVPGSETHLFSRDVFRETSESSSLLHEVAAAAIQTFKSGHSFPLQQRSRLSDPPASMREPR